MRLKPAQVKAAERAVATVNTHRNTLEHLERIAQVYPPLRPRVEELRKKAEYAEQLGQLLIQIHSDPE